MSALVNRGTSIFRACETNFKGFYGGAAKASGVFAIMWLTLNMPSSFFTVNVFSCGVANNTLSHVYFSYARYALKSNVTTGYLRRSSGS